ncbi:peptidase inhibitor family I36 protein [Kitasatospora sp. NPDC059673]|uniref:peptidase inhibitor family I36 protein n=1 Tax=Kitasatospora sp. NPDC059673 TaxID=3346901 RepID=UPI0036D19719
MHVKRIVAGLAVAAISFGVLSNAAVAIAAPTGCDSGYICLYRDDDYKGGGWFRNQPGNHWNLNDEGFGDEMNSWYNNSGVDAKWFENVNLGGYSRCMNSNSSNHSLSLMDYDNASSVAMYTDQYAC